MKGRVGIICAEKDILFRFVQVSRDVFQKRLDVLAVLHRGSKRQGGRDAGVNGREECMWREIIIVS